MLFCVRFLGVPSLMRVLRLNLLLVSLSAFPVPVPSLTPLFGSSMVSSVFELLLMPLCSQLTFPSFFLWSLFGPPLASTSYCGKQCQIYQLSTCSRKNAVLRPFVFGICQGMQSYLLEGDSAKHASELLLPEDSALYLKSLDAFLHHQRACRRPRSAGAGESWQV